MKYYISTTSTQKIGYIKSEIERFSKATPEFRCVNVNSDISNQPLSLAETKSGAINRATATFNSGTERQRLGIGLENGLTKTKRADLNLICVVCLYDGHKAVTTTSKPLPIPSEVTVKVLKGCEYGKAIREYAKNNKPNRSFPAETLIELINRENSFRSALQQCFKVLKLKVIDIICCYAKIVKLTIKYQECS